MQEIAGDITSQIKEMLGAGIPQHAIANTLGIDPSYISQLLQDPEFSTEVQVKQIANLRGATDRDKKLEALEDKAIEKLDQLVQFVTRPLEAARILSVVNNTKRRGAELGGNAGVGGAPIVQLVLPEAARVTFTFNQSSQIVDVEGRSMAPLPSARIQQMLVERSKPKEADVKAANTIYDQIGGETLIPLAPPVVKNVLGAAE